MVCREPDLGQGTAFGEDELREEHGGGWMDETEEDGNGFKRGS